MPFLWNVGQRFSKNKKTTPSPKRKNNTYFGGFIERASLPAFLTGRVAAGMTVEAAIVLPLFLFFFVNLGSAMEMIRLHGNLQLALWDVGNRMCVYGYVGAGADDIADAARQESDRDWWDEIGDVVLSYTYVKGQVVEYVGEEYLEESPLSHGAGGLQFLESNVGEQASVEDSGDVLDIVLTYQISPPLEIPYLKSFRMSNRYYGRMWTGYDLGDREKVDVEEDVVYVAENAEVYHETPDCTHLRLSIREVSLPQALQERNENGGKYDRCSKCGEEEFRGTVYIASEGDFYHMSRECSGLKRTVYTMPRKQAQGKYPACSRCMP